MSKLSQEPAVRRRLLLVEDDSSVVASLRMSLEGDYEIHSASTVRGGVDLFKSLHPALVVLDLRLADGSGLDVLRQMRALDATAPVIVLTGYASLSSVEESLRLGAADFLHKPFDAFALKVRLDQLAGRRTGRPGPADAVLESLAKTLPAIAELELQAHASAMFLHDAANPIMAALGAANYLCQTLEATPERFTGEMCEMGAILYRSMAYVAGLFDHGRPLELLGGLERSTIPIGKVVTLAREMTAAKAARLKVALTVDLPEPGAMVCVNHFALVRVLVNLLNNAVAAVASNTGEVCLSVSNGKEHLTFSVQDNGRGIDPLLMDRIFEARFTTKEEGTGMGLYICKFLVERMGGTLTVRNVPGTGCRFSVGIPHSL